MRGDLTIPDLVVLALLREKPRHGYALYAELERRDVKDWAAVSRAQVYYCLEKLERAGHLARARPQGPPGGPEPVPYATTPVGARALASALEDESWSTRRPPPAFLTWMALSSHGSRRTKSEQTARRRAFLEAEHARETATLAAVHAEVGKDSEAALMIELTLRHFETELTWLKEVERRLP